MSLLVCERKRRLRKVAIELLQHEASPNKNAYCELNTLFNPATLAWRKSVWNKLQTAHPPTETVETSVYIMGQSHINSAFFHLESLSDKDLQTIIMASHIWKGNLSLPDKTVIPTKVWTQSLTTLKATVWLLRSTVAYLKGGGGLQIIHPLFKKWYAQRDVLVYMVSLFDIWEVFNTETKQTYQRQQGGMFLWR